MQMGWGKNLQSLWPSKLMTHTLDKARRAVARKERKRDNQKAI